MLPLRQGQSSIAGLQSGLRLPAHFDVRCIEHCHQLVCKERVEGQIADEDEQPIRKRALFYAEGFSGSYDDPRRDVVLASECC